jgi:CelD/BcsL family acetyltransferase involved in cellulose biosynthesis
VRYRALMSSMSRIAMESGRADEASVRAATGVRVLVRPAATALAALAEEWTALAANASEPNPFAEHWFVAASLPNLAAGREVLLLEARRGARLIGLVPVAVETGYARLPVRFLQNWYHDHMFLGTPLVAAGEETAFWAAILAMLDRAAWAPNFLHLRGLVEGGPVHRGLAAARRSAIVHRRVRAFLASDLAPEAYYHRAVRQKKRKEIRRLRNRLADIGPVAVRALADPAELDAWCAAYLALEKAGWKGAAGSALAGDRPSELFFRDAVRGAWDAGRLQFLRLDVGGQPIAMLVNFLTAPGSFSFKTVFDEAFARFSPGVLIQLENLAILGHPDIAWMDSCALPDHPMIESLWMERRTVVRLTVPLKGPRRFAAFAFCRALEMGSAMLRKRIK